MSSIELSLSLICISVAPIKPLWNSWFPHHFKPSDGGHTPSITSTLATLGNSDTPAQGDGVLTRVKPGFFSLFKRQSKSGRNVNISAPPWRDIDPNVSPVDVDVNIVGMGLNQKFSKEKSMTQITLLN